MARDVLGERMKEFYEYIPKTKLMRRTPVAIRIDGKAFHTFTKGFRKPFDRVLISTMQRTMKYLCENIQGCVLGYTQSDEITLILVDYKKLNSAAWFDYEIQKMCSVAASMATMTFNKVFAEMVEDYKVKCYTNDALSQGVETQQEQQRYIEVLCKAVEKGAMFDARVFNIPKEEVTNLIYWRQVDATRNSIQMVGQANFSHKELQNKSCDMIQDMLFTQKSINWDALPTNLKRGSCCIKILDFEIEYENGIIVGATHMRTRWVIDNEIPIFKGEDRQYIEKLINFKEE